MEEWTGEQLRIATADSDPAGQIGGNVDRRRRSVGTVEHGTRRRWCALMANLLNRRTSSRDIGQSPVEPTSVVEAQPATASVPWEAASRRSLRGIKPGRQNELVE